MKKLFLILLAVMTAVCLTACGGGGDEVVTGDSTVDELPVTIATEDAADVWFTDSTDATDTTDATETESTEATEDPAVTTVSEATTEATTTTTESTTAATTTKSTTTKATTTQTTTATTTTATEAEGSMIEGPDDDEEVEILWEDGINRDEFEAMMGIDSSLDVNG